jgi:hypothetical protein
MADNAYDQVEDKHFDSNSIGITGRKYHYCSFAICTDGYCAMDKIYKTMVHFCQETLTKVRIVI